jgi:hypothetical protein
MEKKVMVLGFFFWFRVFCIFSDVVKIAPPPCLAENEGYL